MTDDDKRAVTVSRREEDQSIKQIATVIGVSVGTMHGVLAESSNN